MEIVAIVFFVLFFIFFCIYNAWYTQKDNNFKSDNRVIFEQFKAEIKDELKTEIQTVIGEKFDSNCQHCKSEVEQKINQMKSEHIDDIQSYVTFFNALRDVKFSSYEKNMNLFDKELKDNFFIDYPSYLKEFENVHIKVNSSKYLG